MALPTWGQKCLVSEIVQNEKVNLDLGHPVRHSFEKLLTQIPILRFFYSKGVLTQDIFSHYERFHTQPV